MENTILDPLIVKAQTQKLKCDISGRAHYLSADISAKWKNRLVVPSIVLSSIVGATLFASQLLTHQDFQFVKILLGLFSLISAVLITLDSRLQLADSREKSRLAGVRYRAVARNLDMFVYEYTGKLSDDKSRNKAIKEFKALNERLEGLALESPTIKDKIYDLARKEVISES